MKSGKKNQENYVPPKWGLRYVKAVLDPEVKPTITARCENAQINPTTLWKAEKNEQFNDWLKGELSKGLGIEIGDARQALHRQMRLGNMEAIKFWYQRYGDFIPTERLIVKDGDLSGVPSEDLEQAYRLVSPKSSSGASSKVN